MSKELAIIKPFKYHDTATGDHIKISVSENFTKLSINNRDYFFDLVTGIFNGTGMDMSNYIVHHDSGDDIIHVSKA